MKEDKIVEKIKQIFQEELQKIEENIELEEDEKNYKRSRLESKLVRTIIEVVKTDEEKVQLLHLCEKESCKTEIIMSMRNDETKISLLDQIEKVGDKADIIETFNYENKIKFLNILENEEKDGYLRRRIIRSIEKEEVVLQVLETKKDLHAKEKAILILKLRNTEKVREIFEQNPEIKSCVIMEMIEKIKWNQFEKEDWEWVKQTEIKDRLVSHLGRKIESIKDSRRLKPEEVKDEILQEIQEHFEASEIGDISEIDLDAANEPVIYDEEQLKLNVLQKNYKSFVKNKEELRKVYIKDLGGTITMNTRHNPGNIQTWQNLWENLKRKEQYELSDDFFLDVDFRYGESEEPIITENIDGRTYVNGNGNHRMTMLKLKYLSEIKRAEGDAKKVQDINEEYFIYTNMTKEIPKDIEELIAVNLIHDIGDIQGQNQTFEEIVQNGEKIGYEIREQEQILKLIGKQELIDFLKERLEQLKQEPDKYDQLKGRIEEYKIGQEYEDILNEMFPLEKQQEELELDENENTTTENENEIELTEEKLEETRLGENEFEVKTLKEKIVEMMSRNSFLKKLIPKNWNKQSMQKQLSEGKKYEPKKKQNSWELEQYGTSKKEQQKKQLEVLQKIQEDEGKEKIQTEQMEK